MPPQAKFVGDTIGQFIVSHQLQQLSVSVQLLQGSSDKGVSIVRSKSNVGLEPGNTLGEKHLQTGAPCQICATPPGPTGHPPKGSSHILKSGSLSTASVGSLL